MSGEQIQGAAPILAPVNTEASAPPVPSTEVQSQVLQALAGNDSAQPEPPVAAVAEAAPTEDLTASAPDLHPIFGAFRVGVFVRHIDTKSTFEVFGVSKRPDGIHVMNKAGEWIHAGFVEALQVGE